MDVYQRELYREKARMVIVMIDVNDDDDHHEFFIICISKRLN